jgi:hypothetical protein
MDPPTPEKTPPRMDATTSNSTLLTNPGTSQMDSRFPSSFSPAYAAVKASEMFPVNHGM